MRIQGREKTEQSEKSIFGSKPSYIYIDFHFFRTFFQISKKNKNGFKTEMNDDLNPKLVKVKSPPKQGLKKTNQPVIFSGHLPSPSPFFFDENV